MNNQKGFILIEVFFLLGMIGFVVACGFLISKCTFFAF